MPRWLAASISITSMAVASWIVRHDSHTRQGVIVGPCSQLIDLARILAIEVLPVPRGPGEQVGVRYAVELDSVPQRLHDVRLARPPGRSPVADGCGRART